MQWREIWTSCHCERKDAQLTIRKRLSDPAAAITHDRARIYAASGCYCFYGLSFPKVMPPQQFNGSGPRYRMVHDIWTVLRSPPRSFKTERLCQILSILEISPQAVRHVRDQQRIGVVNAALGTGGGVHEQPKSFACILVVAAFSRVDDFADVPSIAVVGIGVRHRAPLHSAALVEGHHASRARVPGFPAVAVGVAIRSRYSAPSACRRTAPSSITSAPVRRRSR
ncbi:MAG: hypothetical protein CALGDGBN_02558 [Pseudomonadales bacterium]|nr:hypothetical protein [Pseudomonadales bacterium]